LVRRSIVSNHPLTAPIKETTKSTCVLHAKGAPLDVHTGPRKNETTNSVEETGLKKKKSVKKALANQETPGDTPGVRLACKLTVGPGP